MLPKYHIIFGVIFALGTLYFFPQIGLIGATIIFVSSVLIDVDHYIGYAILEKDLSLKNAYNWHLIRLKKFRKLSREEKNKHKHEIVFLHGIEILLIAFLLSYIWSAFLFIFIGFSFHLFMDILHQRTYQDRIDKFSLVWDIIKRKKLERLF